MEIDGWRADPLGTHEERFFKQGEATPLVRDRGIGSYDEPIGGGMDTPGTTSLLQPGTQRITTAPIPVTDVPPTEQTPVVVGPPTRSVRLNLRRPGPSSSRHSSPRSPPGLLIVVLATLGLIAAAVAVVYSAIPAGSLPSLLGRQPGVGAYRTGRAETAAAVAIVLLVVPIVITVRSYFPELVRRAWRRLLGR